MGWPIADFGTLQTNLWEELRAIRRRRVSSIQRRRTGQGTRNIECGYRQATVHDQAAAFRFAVEPSKS